MEVASMKSRKIRKMRAGCLADEETVCIVGQDRLNDVCGTIEELHIRYKLWDEGHGYVRVTVGSVQARQKARIALIRERLISEV